MAPSVEREIYGDTDIMMSCGTASVDYPAGRCLPERSRRSGRPSAGATGSRHQLPTGLRHDAHLTGLLQPAGGRHRRSD